MRVRIRCHGDYNLSELLAYGQRLRVIDFEDRPGSRWGERRIKRSPLRDVAAMIRSCDYACGRTWPACSRGAADLSVRCRAEDVARLCPWCSSWAGWTCVRFVRAYMDTCRELGFQPASEPSFRVLLPCCCWRGHSGSWKPNCGTGATGQACRFVSSWKLSMTWRVSEHPRRGKTIACAHCEAWYHASVCILGITPAQAPLVRPDGNVEWRSGRRIMTLWRSSCGATGLAT